MVGSGGVLQLRTKKVDWVPGIDPKILNTITLVLGVHFCKASLVFKARPGWKAHEAICVVG